MLKKGVKMKNLEAYKGIISTGFTCINCSCCIIMNGRNYCNETCKCPDTKKYLNGLNLNISKNPMISDYYLKCKEII